ncbi:MAG: cache domain-containing protein, partial [Coriobacteriia bacterium]|nr:cache domain-containing protein [Coriobacteriia bacterium]
MHHSAKRPPWWLTAGVAAVVAVTAIGVVMFLRAEANQRREEAQVELAAVATHYSREIQAVCERNRLALALISSSPRIRASAERIVRGMASPEDESLVLERMAALVRIYRFGHVWLVDPSGRRLLAAGGDERDSAALRTAVGTAFRTGKATMTDLHRPSADGPPHVDFVAPLAAQEGAAPVAAIVASVSADEFLYPTIAAWPGAESTGEAMLLKRLIDGSVLISSPLRLVSDPPLTRSLPATATS